MWIRIGGNGKIWTVRGLDNQVLREWRADAGVHAFKDYVWTGRDLLAEVQRTPNGGSWTETALHAGTDHLSSVRKLTDATGHVVGNHIYYPFGKELTSSIDTERIKWAGYERDLWNTSSTADDLDYLHARSYNPQLGRFLQIDPLSGQIGRPQSLNRYSYVLGNPLGLVDPRGLDDEPPSGTFTDTTTVTAKDPCARPIEFWACLKSLIGNGANFGGGGGNYFLDVGDSGIKERLHPDAVGGPRVVPVPVPPLPPAPTPKDPVLEILNIVSGDLHPWRNESQCGGGAFGIIFQGSGVNSMTSTGGGTAGFALMFLPGGIAGYTFSTPSKRLSVGGAVGASITWVFAFGTGSFGGDSTAITGGYGPYSGDIFSSVPNNSSGGWSGLDLGIGTPIPSAALTTENYQRQFALGHDYGCF